MIAFVVSVIVKKLDKLASLLLALMLVLFVVLVHLPGAIGGDFKGIIGMARDIAMAGAALMYAQGYAHDSRFV